MRLRLLGWLVALTAVLVTLVLSPPVQCKVVYVNQSSSGGEDGHTFDGQTWGTAYRTIQEGVDSARPSQLVETELIQQLCPGDEVWVATGIYNECVTLKPGIGLWGGFGGAETSRDERGWGRTPTIVDGQGTGSVITVPAGAPAFTTVSGFVIRNGNAASGGGIYSRSAGCTITNNIVSGNQATVGAGIYCTDATVTVCNNVIADNSAPQGGGIYLGRVSGRLSGNTIVRNEADRLGGGIMGDGCSASIANNIIALNSSGIVLSSDESVLKCNCIYGNTLLDCSGASTQISTLHADPLLADVSRGDYHVLGASPCIDAGSDGSIVPCYPDMDGSPRLFGEHVDIGADEAVASPARLKSGSSAMASADAQVLAAGRIIYVKADSAGPTHDGTSWTCAYQQVQQAMNAAASGDEIWVARGTYVENITATSGVALYGGFSGTETGRTQRDWGLNTTILDGNKLGTVITVSQGASTTTTVDGFTIENGTGTLDSSQKTIGGGVLCISASPTIQHNQIVVNNAYYGAGIYGSNSSAVVTDNIICSNEGSVGIGICFYFASSPQIMNNVIRGNRAGTLIWGGGIACGNDVSATIANNLILENKSTNNGTGLYGAGIYCTSSAPKIYNNTIVRNGTDSNSGAGVYAANCTSPVTLTGNIIAFNTSGCKASSSTITSDYNCVYGNTAYDYHTSVTAGTHDKVNVDPVFVNAGNSNFHLSVTSPCLNAGSAAVVQGTTDIDGQARLSGSVDIGADEYWAPYTIYVTTAGLDTNDGRTWSTAKRTLQAAMRAAMPCGDVWVAASPTAYIGQVRLRDCVGLYGGFVGGETTRDQRSPQSNLTTIDGSNATTVVYAPPGLGQSAVIDGFTIRNGYAANCGGAVRCDYSSPTISHNVMTSNSADYGGGVYGAYSSAVVASNTISNNTAMMGAGICFYYASSPTITNNVIKDNNGSGDQWGGGVACGEDVSATISDNMITGNVSDRTGTKYGCGVWCYRCGPTQIIGNTIAANGVAGARGGGICFDAGMPSSAVNNIVSRNSSGFYAPASFLSLNNNCVFGNVESDYDPRQSPGTNDIQSDPRFIDVVGKDYHISYDSPCVDGGDVSVVRADPPSYDIDGQSRILLAAVDIGADELDQVASPTFAPGGGNYAAAQTVRISCPTAGAVIRYTIDGLDPTDTSTIYAGPITVSTSSVLRARGYRNDMVPSGVTSAQYIIGNTPLLPQWTGSPVVDPTGTVKLSWSYTPTLKPFHHASLFYYDGGWKVHNLFPLLSTSYPDYRVWSMPMGTDVTCSFKVIMYESAVDTVGIPSTVVTVPMVQTTPSLPGWYTEYTVPSQLGGAYVSAY